MVPPGTALVPVSFGELVDKITILEIKCERIDDAGKLVNVRVELELLATALARFSVLPPRAGELKAELRRINEALWEIEDQIRVCERKNDFGPEFVRLARRVYMTNDRRSAVKRASSVSSRARLIVEENHTLEVHKKPAPPISSLQARCAHPRQARRRPTRLPRQDHFQGRGCETA